MSSEKTKIFGQQLSEKVPSNQRAAFAKAIGVSTEAVRKWCKSASLPNSAQLIEIQRVLGVSIDWLLIGHQFSKQNPGIVLMDKADEYPIIKSIIPRINRGMREGMSEQALAETIQKLAELELVRLRDLLKSKEKEKEGEGGMV